VRQLQQKHNLRNKERRVRVMQELHIW